GDPPFRRDVGHVGLAEEGQQVMLADRVEGDVPNDHHLFVADIEEDADLVFEAAPDTREHLTVGRRDPAGRVLESRPLGVFTDRFQDHAYRGFDLAVVEGPAVGTRPVGFDPGDAFGRARVRHRRSPLFPGVPASSGFHPVYRTGSPRRRATRAAASANQVRPTASTATRSISPGSGTVGWVPAR